MRGSFFGLNVALSGLYSAQRSLDVVNHNVNNANTPGFSRQYALQNASKPISMYNGTGMVGTGSEVTGVKRMRDEYLDFKYWSENRTYGEWLAKQELLADMEVTFNEPSDSGFTTIFNEFYNSLQELSKDPGSQSVRVLVRQQGITTVKYFNNLATHYEKLQADVNQRVKIKVDEVNSLASQIQQLNRQIYISELDGNSANDLRDRRTLLVDKLAQIVNIETNEIIVGKLPNGENSTRFSITVSGNTLVDHFTVNKIVAKQRDADNRLNEEDIPNLYDLYWEDGNSVIVRGGELRGYLDVRDGNDGKMGIDGSTESPAYKGIPHYIKKLNEFVRIFAKAFNEGEIRNNDGTVTKVPGHADGYRFDSDIGDSAAGIRFFTMIGTDGMPMSSANFLNLGGSDIYANITAKHFSISFDIMDDFNAICVSGASGEVENKEILDSLLNMRHNPHMFNEGAPEDFMKSLIATLGIDSQQAVRYSKNQKTIVQQIDNRRLSVSGVLVDEEMTNMVKFQHAYNASARMITTMAEIYDTLINKMGV